MSKKGTNIKSVSVHDGNLKVWSQLDNKSGVLNRVLSIARKLEEPNDITIELRKMDKSISNKKDNND